MAIQRKNGDDVEKIMVNALTTAPWWGTINEDEKKPIIAETYEVGELLVKRGQNDQDLGRVFASLQARLEPHGLFLKYLKMYNLPWVSVYRQIRLWKNAQEKFPAEILKQATLRGIELVGKTEERPYGVYTEAVMETPIPRKPTPAKAGEWLDKVIEAHVPRKPIQGITAADMRIDKVEMMRECFNVVRRRMRRLPEEDRIAWAERLCGMILTSAGASRIIKISPVEIPKGWILEMGRPKKVA